MELIIFVRGTFDDLCPHRSETERPAKAARLELYRDSALSSRAEADDLASVGMLSSFYSAGCSELSSYFDDPFPRRFPRCCLCCCLS